VNQEESNETYAQYSFRLARESRLRKEAAARELLEKKRESQKKYNEAYRQRSIEKYEQFEPSAMELVSKVAAVEALRTAFLANRRATGLCVCCGDARGKDTADYCQECWSEIKYGVIKTPTVSSRQVESAKCRVVRKGTEMS